MNKTILQVPITKELKTTAEQAAVSQGFSSLQEAVRLFLNKLAHGAMQITFEETTQLSPKAYKRYDKMIDDIENGKVKTSSFSDPHTLMEYLNK